MNDNYREWRRHLAFHEAGYAAAATVTSGLAGTGQCDLTGCAYKG